MLPQLDADRCGDGHSDHPTADNSPRYHRRTVIRRFWPRRIVVEIQIRDIGV